MLSRSKLIILSLMLLAVQGFRPQICRKVHRKATLMSSTPEGSPAEPNQPVSESPVMTEVSIPYIVNADDDEFASASSSEDDFSENFVNTVDDTMDFEREKLKSQLFKACAACDRGFGASSGDVSKILGLVDELAVLSPELIPTRGLSPNNDLDTEVPIEGVWKMVFTTASDVLVLSLNPLTQVRGIYQAIKRDGASTNVIDLAPKPEQLLPKFLIGEGSMTRALVSTRAKARSESRVGLQFLGATLKPMTLLGLDLQGKWFAPPFKVEFPQLTLFGSENSDSVDSPGFFDVVYLDTDCLIIKQNEPGGIFVNIRDDDESILADLE